MWRLTEPDLEALAVGAGILGTGGGGNPYPGKLRTYDQFRPRGAGPGSSPRRARPGPYDGRASFTVTRMRRTQ